MLEDFSHVDEWGPEKIVTVADPKSGMRGVLVIDNTARGMGKGGTRMSPTLTTTEVCRLARVMTWKWAAADLRFGGAKAGIRFDPAAAERETVLRRFVRALASEVPEEYVFGLDMGLTENDAAIIQDELGSSYVAVGSPRELGGVPYDRWGITGYGVAEACAAALQHTGRDVREARVVVQGFGAVGAAAAERLHELGACIIGVSTAIGAVFDPDGLDVPALLAARSEHGDACIRDLSGVKELAAGEELELDGDVLIPAALQDVIDAQLASRLRFGLVAEGANLPCTPDALEVLARRGVPVVPDFIANAGGIVAAAYAMQARGAVFPVERDTVLETVSTLLRRNTNRVLDKAAADGTTPHNAAREIAKARVRAAMAARDAARTRSTARD